MILIVQHISIERPGTLGDFFKRKGREFKTIEIYTGHHLPDSLAEIEALIVLGGPMNVYEEDKYPFLKEEDVFLKKAIEQKVPILGICLGAQLLAKACGARVRKAAEQEMGWHKVQLLENRENDSLFKGVDREFDVFQWHQDTFDVPERSYLLASSLICKNQAFRFGKNAYGLQFHIEITDREITRWGCEYNKEEETQKMLEHYYKIKEKFNRQANTIYSNFERLIYASC